MKTLTVKECAALLPQLPNSALLMSCFEFTLHQVELNTIAESELKRRNISFDSATLLNLSADDFNRKNKVHLTLNRNEIEVAPQLVNQETIAFVLFSDFKLQIRYYLEENDFCDFTLQGNQITVTKLATVLAVFDLALLFAQIPSLELNGVPELNSQEITAAFGQLTSRQKRKSINNIMLARKPSAGLLLLNELNLLHEFLPELTAGKALSQNRFHAYDIFEHLLRACDGAVEADLNIRWAALLHDVGKVPTRKVKENGEASFHNHEMLSAKMVVPIMKRFAIPKEVGQKIKFLVRNHMFHYTNEWTDKAIRRFIRKISQEDLQDLIALRLADRKGSGKKTAFPKSLQKLIDHIDEVYASEQELKVKHLEISGHDLMTMGVEPGPAMGSILKQLLEAVKAETLVNEKEKLIETAKELIQKVKV